MVESSVSSKSNWSRRDIEGVAVLELGVLGSPINTFNDAVAGEFLEHLGDLGAARALVVSSAKPRSWVNGVGLLKAQVTRDADKAAEQSSAARRAFWALKDLAIPTVAAVRGHCFGCGVEFALKCDARVAVDGFDTHFYMTELDEYLFVPAFGGTVELPRLLGLDRACEMLLWGERVFGRRALEWGLVDAVVDDPEELIPAAVELALSPHKSQGADRAKVYEVPDANKSIGYHSARVAELPELERGIFERALEIMVDASAAPPQMLDVLYERELIACGESLAQEAAREALGMFTLRTAAGSPKLYQASHREVAFEVAIGAEASALAFVRALEEKRLERVHVLGGFDVDAALTLRLGEDSAPIVVAGIDATLEGPLRTSGASVVWSGHLGSMGYAEIMGVKPWASALADVCRRMGVLLVERPAGAPAGSIAGSLLSAQDDLVAAMNAQGIGLDVMQASLASAGHKRFVGALGGSPGRPMSQLGALDVWFAAAWEGFLGCRVLELLESGELVSAYVGVLACIDVMGYPRGRGIFEPRASSWSADVRARLGAAPSWVVGLPGLERLGS
ncbi:MAG: enoyl-CoA hydratase/isomerase family protein [Myxococcota bacterium]